MSSYYEFRIDKMPFNEPHFVFVNVGRGVDNKTVNLKFSNLKSRLRSASKFRGGGVGARDWGLSERIAFDEGKESV